MKAEYDYSDALNNAPQWVKMAYEEYTKMGDEYISKNPFLWFLLGDGKGTPPYKSNKKEAKYIDPSPHNNLNCGNCIYYYKQPIRQIGICSWIRGKVDYEAFCKFYRGVGNKKK